MRGLLYASISLAAFAWTVFKGPSYAQHLMGKLECRYKVRIVARLRYYAVRGDIPWWQRLWVNLLIFLAHFAIYFSPFLVVGVLGWTLGIFK